MPPAPKSGAKKGDNASGGKPGGVGLEMPIDIRRNYITRTYSGDNLLKSDKLMPVERQIHKSSQMLIWENKKNVSILPELSKLDFKAEMKLFDIVFGEDPLMEGTTTQEHNIKIAKQAQKNLQNALSTAGSKRGLLKERYYNILNSIRVKIQESVAETNSSVHAAIQEFLLIWENQADQAKEHLNTISVEKVAEIGLEELKVSKRRLNGNIDASLLWIKEFETKMESIEAERAQKLVNDLKEAGNQLKRLKFERAEVIEEMLRKEAEPLNIVLIKNREIIFKFVHNLSLVVSELRSISQKYCKEADTNWHRLRYSYIFPQFEKEIAAALNVDFKGFYNVYQSKFDSFSESILEEIRVVLSWKPENGLKHTMPAVKKDSERIIRAQDEAITSFSSDLEKLEKDMDKKSNATYSYWIPLIKECKKEGSADMKSIISKVRKTTDINAGKQASLSLFSKAAKNNFLLHKVTAFISCISYTTSIFHQVQMLETEAEVAKEQRDLHKSISSEIIAAQKLFHLHLSAIKTETNDINIPILREKAKEILQEIHQKHIERFEKCVEHLHSFEEKAKIAHASYKERLLKLFSDDRKQLNQSEEGVEVPLDLHMDERDANLYELQYWPVKIEEWRQDQLAMIDHMKNNNIIIPEIVEPTSTKSIIKKTVSKKEIVNEMAPPTPKKERKEDMELLDGTLMYSVRDPVKVMEKMSMVSEPYIGQFFEYVEKTDEVVDIRILDGLKVKEERLELQKRVEKDANVIWDLVYKEIKKKINLKINQLTGERTRHFADFESVSFELEEIVQKRFDQLPKIQLHHENEARFLIDTIHGIRDLYSKKIEEVFKEIDEFSQVSLKELHTSLLNSHSVYDVKKVDTKFTLLLERFNFDVSDALEKANLDFDHARKMLEKSKQPGNHSSAWLIVKEASGYDPENIGPELEKWKLSIAEDLARAQREITAEIKMMQKEIEHFHSDFKMMAATDAKIKNLKILLLGEKIYAQKLQEELGNQIQKYEEQSYEEHTWANCISWISQAVEIETRAIEISKYLSLSDPGRTFKYCTTFKPSLESWKAWQSKYEAPRSGKTKISMTNSPFQSRPPSGSLLKTPSSAAKSSKPQTRGTTGLSFSQNGDDIINGSGDLLRPISSSSSKSRPLSANSIGTTPKVTPDPNLRRSTPARSMHKEDFAPLPNLPLKNVDFETKLLACPQKKPFRCLETIFKDWIDNSRQEIVKTYDEFSVTLKDRDIRKKESIAATRDEYIRNLDSRFNLFLDSCDEFFEKEIICLFDHATKFSAGIDRLINTTFSAVKENALDKLNSAWKTNIQDFLVARKTIQKEKTYCLEQLKTSLGHPTMAAELQDLHEKSKKINMKMMDLIEDTKETTLRRFEVIANDFLARVLFLSTFIGDIAANWDFNSNSHTTPPSTAAPLEPIDVTMIPFETIQTIFKDFTIALPSAEFKKTQTFIYVRTNVLTAVSDRLKNLLTILEEHCNTETTIEQNWATAWSEKIYRIRSAF